MPDGPALNYELAVRFVIFVEPPKLLTETPGTIPRLSSSNSFSF
jgi:hypothetical protein